MGRHPNPERRTELLDDIVDYAASHSDITMRPLARDLDVSTYTLTYQFGDRARMLAAAVEHALALQQDGVTGAGNAVSPAALVGAMWWWGSKPANVGLMGLLVRAAIDPAGFGGAGNDVVNVNVNRLAAAYDRDGAGGDTVRSATSTWATLVGLFVDLASTGDRDRCEAAVDSLIRSASKVGAR